MDEDEAGVRTGGAEESENTRHIFNLGYRCGLHGSRTEFR